MDFCLLAIHILLAAEACNQTLIMADHNEIFKNIGTQTFLILRVQMAK